MTQLRIALTTVTAVLVFVSAYLVWSSFQGRPQEGVGSQLLPTGGAALVGALIGGGFTVCAQWISARAQVGLQDSRSETERNLADDKWRRDISARTRDTLHPDVRDMLEDLITVNREAEDSKPTTAQAIGQETWSDEWDKIWTESRSLKFDVYRELILDQVARDSLGRIGRLLDVVDDITDPAFPGRLSQPSTRTLGMQLFGSAIHIVAQYLRNEDYRPRDERHWEPLEKKLNEFVAWEDSQVERSIRAAEEEALGAQDREEQAENEDKERQHYEDLFPESDPSDGRVT